MLNCLEPDTTQVIEYCWCEHTILTRNINVPLLSSKCYSITRLSINIFLFCPNITKAEYSHIQYFKIDSITRLARLTSAGSRKFCLRLLGCQPGCTIVYCRLKICAHFRGLVLEYFLTKNCHNRIQFLLYY